MGSELELGAEVISAIAALTLAYSTIKPCKSSGIQYLLGIPAGFALIAVGFITGIAYLTVGTNSPSISLVTGVISILTQTYGLLFISLTYARKTRLRILGESIILEIAIPALITIAAVMLVLLSDPTTGEAVYTLELPLRIVMALCTLYLLYETERDWSFTRRPGQGVVAVAFSFLLVEQIGFILARLDFGDVAIFLGYQGRIVGLAILIAVTIVGINRADANVLKRLGLTALAH